jgi:hypothetical protein
MEVLQATQDLRNTVPLVASKPTVVRIYLSLEGPTTTIHGVSGAIFATRPGGVTLPNWQSANTITVTSDPDINAKRLDLSASLNFILPPEWYAGGTLHIQLSHLLIEGDQSSLPCDGCQLDQIDAPYYVHFQPTRALNLVLAPYDYFPQQSPDTPLTADLLLAPMGILQWVNNVYPVSGKFPEDGSGINLLRILPLHATRRDLSNPNDDGSDFLVDLQDIMDELECQNSWPSGAQLLAMVPFGRGGQAGQRNVAYGDTWASQKGVVPAKHFGFYGSIWAHEIGHQVGRDHAGNSHREADEPSPDLNFPHAHGSIGEPGLATTTEWWNGSPFLVSPSVPATDEHPHAHDFMSYGITVPENHTSSWVSPYTYGALFQKFIQLGQAAAPSRSSPPEKLIISGRIHPDGTFTLRPFRIVPTSFVSGPGAVGQYSIDLIDAEGRNLLTYRFDARKTSESPSLTFSEFVPWKKGAQMIVVKDQSRILAKRAVSAHNPWVRVISPKGGETWATKATVTWEASDDDHDFLTFTVLYNDGRTPLWIPVAEGLTKTSVTLDTTLLPGSTRGRIRVRATDGVNTTEADSNGTFTVSEKRPFVAILGPRDGQVLAPDSDTQFIGAAYDIEDGILPRRSLEWTSDRDGPMGYGQHLKVRAMSRGSHILTLSATDQHGNKVNTRVNVIVGRDRLIPDRSATSTTKESPDDRYGFR